MILSYLLAGRVTPTKLYVLLLLVSSTLCPKMMTVSAQAAATEPTAEQKAEAERRERVKLAVALNYCRASFHRINKYQTKDVLVQEQQRILNNLDLTSIDDAQVIKLYTDVIQEINQIQLVETEEKLIMQRHRRDLTERLFFNAFNISANVATFNYVGAVQSGARSFWDYQQTENRADTDAWKLEKGHLSSLTSKTTNFIETSWKLARERNIPDEWLIRDRDIELMYESLQERDLETRLRILKRKEPYLQCFPPYYYYIGRLEQSLGKFQDAAETYRKLRDLESGHMRRDDMLAAGLANLAVIESHFGDPRAIETAQLALKESSDVWEANLICAGILADAGQFDLAEDAVLRNLDVALETHSSRNSLALVYSKSGDREKLARHLNDGEFVASLRAPVLLKCALAMGPKGLPAPASQKLLASLHGRVNLSNGRDDLVITASEDWMLGGAHLKITYDGRVLGRPLVSRERGQLKMVYKDILEIGTPWRQTHQVRPLAMEVTFPDQPSVAFHLTPGSMATARKTLELAGRPQLPGAQANGYLLTNVRSEEYAIAFDGSQMDLRDPPQLVTPKESIDDQTQVTQQEPTEEEKPGAKTFQASQPAQKSQGVQEANPGSPTEQPARIETPAELLAPGS
ncbi:MAG: hypothetical protein HUJ26_23850 [Planctomycetaceae bacterium]|nr:hypothetical protein [Planctomycetaceae bacterium]